MPFGSGGKLVRVVCSATNDIVGTEVNTLHYDLSDHDALGANDPQSLADFFRDNVTDKLRACFTNAWQIQPFVVMEEKDPLNPNAPRGEWQSGSPTLGTINPGTDPLPPSCCAVATLKTDFVGRRHTGRLFLPGDTHENDQNNGQWINVGGMLTVWQNYLDAIPRQPDISGPGSTSTCNWVVYSRTNRAQSEPTYVAHVKSVVLHTKVHWLRSRTP